MNCKRLILSSIFVGTLLLFAKLAWLSIREKQPENLTYEYISSRWGYTCKSCGQFNYTDFPNQCDSHLDGVNIHNYQELSHHACQSIRRSCQIDSCAAAIDIVVLWIDIDDDKMKKLLDFTLESIGSENKVLDKRHTLRRRNQMMMLDGPRDLRRKPLRFAQHIPKGTRFVRNKNRYRDLHQLKYLLRSIDENGKQWARRIFLITNNQIPSFLNVNNPRIRVISHQQLLQYSNLTAAHALFNSISIQSMVHNIPTLSSPFYLFDDDIVIRNEVPVSAIIEGNKSIIDLSDITFNIGAVRRSMYESNICASIRMVLKNKQVPLLVFNNSYHVAFHGPILLYKEIGIQIWNEYRQEMNALLLHPFRTNNDPSIQTLYIYMGYTNYYTFRKGRNLLLFDMLSSTKANKFNEVVQRAFQPTSALFMCLNDDLPSVTEPILNALIDAYDSLFPRKSKFES